MMSSLLARKTKVAVYLYSRVLRWCRYQLNPLYVLITVVAYMMKDRIKEWGKRYLQPVCVKFGFEFPDRIVKVSGNCEIAMTCNCGIRNGQCQST